jgi:enoyl-CoA hydratase
MRTNLDASSLRAALELENLTQSLCAGTSGHREALAAFLEKRPPNFQQEL